MCVCVCTGCGIGVAGMRALGAALDGNTTVEELYLGGTVQEWFAPSPHASIAVCVCVCVWCMGWVEAWSVRCGVVECGGRRGVPCTAHCVCVCVCVR